MTRCQEGVAGAGFPTGGHSRVHDEGEKRLDESLISVTRWTVLQKQLLEKRRCGILFQRSHCDESLIIAKKTCPGESLLHGILCGFRWSIGLAFPGLVWSFA
jgi:hypothetical protein